MLFVPVPPILRPSSTTSICRSPCISWRRPRFIPTTCSSSSESSPSNQPESNKDNTSNDAKESEINQPDWRSFRARLVELERTKDGLQTTEKEPSTKEGGEIPEDDTSSPKESSSSSAAAPTKPAEQTEQTEQTTPASKTESTADESTATSSSPSPQPAPPATSPPSSPSLPKKRWVHEVGAIEKGCLLLASPAHFGARQQYFSQTVIFVLDHSPQTGTVGIILNRPLTYSLSSVPISVDAQQSWAGILKSPAFENSPLYLGGPMEQGRLVLIHSEKSIKDCTTIIDGVYAGGLPDALEKVKRNEIDGERLRFFSGYSGWGPGQLQNEVNLGVWYVAAGSTDVITSHCVKLKRPLYRQVLEMMGGRYKEIVEKFDEMDGGKYVI